MCHWLPGSGVTVLTVDQVRLDRWVWCVEATKALIDQAKEANRGQH